MDVVLDRFQTLEGLLIKYNYQGGDSVTIITNDKLRLVEASGDPNCFWRLHIAEVSPNKEPIYEGMCSEEKMHQNNWYQIHFFYLKPKFLPKHTNNCVFWSISTQGSFSVSSSIFLIVIVQSKFSYYSLYFCCQSYWINVQVVDFNFMLKLQCYLHACHVHSSKSDFNSCALFLYLIVLSANRETLEQDILIWFVGTQCSIVYFFLYWITVNKCSYWFLHTYLYLFWTWLYAYGSKQRFHHQSTAFWFVLRVI